MKVEIVFSNSSVGFIDPKIVVYDWDIEPITDELNRNYDFELDLAQKIIESIKNNNSCRVLPCMVTWLRNLSNRIELEIPEMQNQWLGCRDYIYVDKNRSALRRKEISEYDEDELDEWSELSQFAKECVDANSEVVDIVPRDEEEKPR